MRMPVDQIDMIRTKSAEFLAGLQTPLAIEDIKLASDAWTILHRSGAYMALEPKMPGGYPDYADAHLQTALEKIFVNAEFKEAKRY